MEIKENGGRGSARLSLCETCVGDKVKRWEVDFYMRRGNKLSRDIVACSGTFCINFGRVALEWNSGLILGGVRKRDLYFI
jgi:hypothetical protein